MLLNVTLFYSILLNFTQLYPILLTDWSFAYVINIMINLPSTGINISNTNTNTNTNANTNSNNNENNNAGKKRKRRSLTNNNMPTHQLHKLREILENSKLAKIFKLNVMSDEMLENFYSSALRCSRSQSQHQNMGKFQEINSDCSDEIILSSWEFVKNMIKTNDDLCAKNKVVVTSPLKAFVQDFIILQMCQN